MLGVRDEDWFSKLFSRFGLAGPNQIQFTPNFHS